MNREKEIKKLEQWKKENATNRTGTFKYDDVYNERLEIFDMSRNELRAYGEQVKTFKNPNGYDLATTDRELQHLTQECIDIIKKLKI